MHLEKGREADEKETGCARIEAGIVGIWYAILSRDARFVRATIASMRGDERRDPQLGGKKKRKSGRVRRRARIFRKVGRRDA